MGKDGEYSKADLDQILQSESKVVLVDFYADWCGPCKVLGPTLEEVAKEKQDEVRVVKVNVDKSSELASFYGIRGIPTMIFFKNGQAQKTEVGNRSKSEIISKLKELS